MQGPLVASHIIPNFQYKPLKEKEGFFFQLSTNPAKKPFKRQKGITEYLLCAKCDNVRLSRYENHLAKVLFGGHPLKQNDTGRILLVEGYDYKAVKNALLSILWRMSLSSDPFFSEVDLGEKHEECLRIGLLNDTDFAEDSYPIALVAPILNGKHETSWSMPPDVARGDGNHVYRCLISGLLFTFFVGSGGIKHEFNNFILRRNSWPILRARVEEIPFLFDACIKMSRASARRMESLKAS